VANFNHSSALVGGVYVVINSGSLKNGYVSVCGLVKEPSSSYGFVSTLSYIKGVLRKFFATLLPTVSGADVIHRPAFLSQYKKYPFSGFPSASTPSLYASILPASSSYQLLAVVVLE
jgi:hypothetical protein